MKLNTIFLFLSFLSSNIYAQSGCTDPQALNFDSEAIANDGSCTYSLTDYTLQQLTLLPDELEECSGIEWIDSGLWIHNDGGNEDAIYRIDSTSGAVLKSVIIATADNIDWEDITEDDNHIYVGDFGNNPGNRTDLRVFRVKKSDLSNNVVNADLIEFEYSDQVDFSANDNNHNFDCEAFFYYNDSLHVFTKNWADHQTKHYVFSATPGSHTAELVETFNVDGLITGADISANNEVVLIGYTDFGVNFMWLLFDYQDHFFFSGNKRRIALGTGLTNSQTEGITFRDNGYGYICSEKFKINNSITLPQKILSFSIKQWVDNTSGFPELDDLYEIVVFPNAFEEAFQVRLSKTIDYWLLYDGNGKVAMSESLDSEALSFLVKADHLPSGHYFLEIVKDGRSKSIQVIKK